MKFQMWLRQLQELVNMILEHPKLTTFEMLYPGALRV